MNSGGSGRFREQVSGKHPGLRKETPQTTQLRVLRAKCNYGDDGRGTISIGVVPLPAQEAELVVR